MLLGEGAVGVPHAWGRRGVSLGLVHWGEGGGEGVEVQKKRPFHSFSSSRGVKLRLLVRYVRREESALSRVGRSSCWIVLVVEYVCKIIDTWKN